MAVYPQDGETIEALLCTAEGYGGTIITTLVAMIGAILLTVFGERQKDVRSAALSVK